MLSRNLQFLIDRRGQSATLIKNTYGAYVPTTGTNASSTPTNYSIKAYFASYSLEELATDSVTMGSRKVAIPARDTLGVAIPEPDAEDVIQGVGDKVIIKSVQKIYNSDTLVCYLCMVNE